MILDQLATDPLLVIHGDCIEKMREFAEGSVDAIVTDPPYGLEFMGKEWDSFRVDKRASRWSAEKSGGAGAGFEERDMGGRSAKFPAYHTRRTTAMCRTCGKRDAFRNPHGCAERADWVTIPVDSTPIEARAFQNWVSLWALEAYRVLKPGGYALVFGGTRTHHRMISGVEDAGFFVRDCLMWLYGSGFPKSLDVSKALDKRAGVEREVLGMRTVSRNIGEVRPVHEQAGHATEVPITAATSELAKKWDGWGTALKPAWEPIVLAQKPIEGTYAENLERHGIGALNIDGARIPYADETERWAPHTDEASSFGISGERKGGDTLGRWPANVILDAEAGAILDAQSGDSTSAPGDSIRYTALGRMNDDAWQPRETIKSGYGDAGGASRFFYTPKASKADRGEGNTHPTVKPVDLMRYLVRLVCPAGGIVLDPFAGSGTTGQAALAEGARCVLIEKEAEYVDGINRWRGAMQIGLGL